MDSAGLGRGTNGSRTRKLAQILNVGVRTGSLVVREIPAGMIGVVVENDRIGAPVPVGYVIELKWRNREIEAIEPESRRTSAREMPNMTRSEATLETTVRKRVVLVKTRVVSGSFVANPSVTVDMWSVGVARLIVETPLYRWWRLMLRSLPHWWRPTGWRRRWSKVPASLRMGLFAAAPLLRGKAEDARDGHRGVENHSVHIKLRRHSPAQSRTRNVRLSP